MGYDNRAKDIVYECGKSGHYRPDCPSLAKKKEKGQRNNSRNSRQAYVAWNSDNDVSSNESSSESDEEANYCFMENHRQGKKKDVSHSKYSNVAKLSFNDLNNQFENLQKKTLYANKKLTSQENIFTYLEAKVEERNENFETLKKLIVKSSNCVKDDEQSCKFGFGHVKFCNKR